MTLVLYVWYCLLYLHPVCSFDLLWLTHAVRGTGTARAIRWHWRVFVEERIGQRLGWKVRWWQPDGTSQSDDVVVQVQNARGFACEPRPNSAATKACPLGRPLMVTASVVMPRNVIPTGSSKDPSSKLRRLLKSGTVLGTVSTHFTGWPRTMKYDAFLSNRSEGRMWAWSASSKGLFISIQVRQLGARPSFNDNLSIVRSRNSFCKFDDLNSPQFLIVWQPLEYSSIPEASESTGRTRRRFHVVFSDTSGFLIPFQIFCGCTITSNMHQPREFCKAKEACFRVCRGLICSPTEQLFRGTENKATANDARRKFADTSGTALALSIVSCLLV